MNNGLSLHKFLNYILTKLKINKIIDIFKKTCYCNYKQDDFDTGDDLSKILIFQFFINPCEIQRLKVNSRG